MAVTRKTKTEAKLQQALITLLPSKGTSGVTVSDICRVAGINRGTFYAHYMDKDDLMEKQIERIVDELKGIILASPALDDATDDDHGLIPQQRVLETLNYLNCNRELLTALTGNGTNMELRERVKEIIGELLEQSARIHGRTLTFGNIPADYGREMALSGITSVIWLWLKKGCAETPEEIAQIVWTNKSCSPEELLAL